MTNEVKIKAERAFVEAALEFAKERQVFLDPEQEQVARYFFCAGAQFGIDLTRDIYVQTVKAAR